MNLHKDADSQFTQVRSPTHKINLVEAGDSLKVTLDTMDPSLICHQDFCLVLQDTKQYEPLCVHADLVSETGHHAVLLTYEPLLAQTQAQVKSVQEKLKVNLEKAKFKQTLKELQALPEEAKIPEANEDQSEHQEDSDSFELEPQEFVFVLDRSGSMYWGDKAIIMAKKALEVFLHSLPEGSFFNICSFGSTFEFLFASSQPYNQ